MIPLLGRDGLNDGFRVGSKETAEDDVGVNVGTLTTVMGLGRHNRVVVTASSTVVVVYRGMTMRPE